MAKQTADKHILSGDFSISGVVKQVDSLSHSLQKLESGRTKKLHVDCGNINSIDMNGLQLLHVWIECARMRGLEVQLVNLPDYMHKTIQQLGVGQCFKNSHQGMDGGS